VRFVRPLTNWTRFSDLLVSAALFIAPSCAKDTSPPAVKKSDSGVCHKLGSTYYDKTTHFKRFQSMEACLASGGRLPANPAGDRPDAQVLQAVCNGYVPKPGDDGVLYGRVTKVIDGDTFDVRIQGAKLGFRMSDIDAPELDQPYGTEARRTLAAAIDNKDVVMLFVEPEIYGRLVVHVWIANLHLNRELVDRGSAWFYPEHAHDNCLFEVENAARDTKRGLWALPASDHTEPWVWREVKRERKEK
jgi:endonuclease YncB( thermonuclease family)